MIGLLLVAVACIAFYIYIYKNWDYKKKFVFKTIMIYLSLGILLLMVWLVVVFVKDAAEEEKADMIETRMERIRYLEGCADYFQMQDALKLYDDYEPEFEYAWERVQMYANCNRYLIFAAAEEAGLGEEYHLMAEKYKEALLSLGLYPDYQQNLPYGEYFLKRAGLLDED